MERKNKGLWLLGGLLGLAFPQMGLAQRILSEGRVDYTVTIVSGADQPGIAEAFNGARQTVWMKGSQVRVDFNSLLRMQSTFYSGSDQTAVILRESGQEKYLIRLNQAQWKHYNRKYDGISYTPTGERKEISGYNCERVTARLTDGSTMSIYYTRDLIPLTRGYEAAFTGLEGLPVEYEVISGPVTVRYSLSGVQTSPVPNSRFDLPKSGFKLLDYKQ